MTDERPGFKLPEISENARGWGPTGMPEQFESLPFQMFSKNDKIQKVRLTSCYLYWSEWSNLICVQVADWTGTLYNTKWNNYGKRYGNLDRDMQTAQNNQYAYIHEV